MAALEKSTPFVVLVLQQTSPGEKTFNGEKVAVGEHQTNVG